MDTIPWMAPLVGVVRGTVWPVVELFFPGTYRVWVPGTILCKNTEC